MKVRSVSVQKANVINMTIYWLDCSAQSRLGTPDLYKETMLVCISLQARSMLVLTHDNDGKAASSVSI